ncbi:MAG: protein kinase, partial [Gemmatimonadales bacterium]
MSDAHTDRLGTALADRYRIERELGAGGMATVYLAEDLKHDRQVAIKVLRPELAAVLGADRFIQEIKTTASLQHPHILPLFDSGQADGFLFFVMPYIEGETLRDRLNRETQLGVEEAVRLTTEVADALDYAHRQGVIHRDIKPENILLHDGRPMVADFGIALAVSAAAGGRMTETGLSLGTPHYMSPEQATAEKDITARSDVYSLASVLYEMLAGEPPHTASSAQAVIMKVIADTPRPVTHAAGASSRSAPRGWARTVMHPMNAVAAALLLTTLWLAFRGPPPSTLPVVRLQITMPADAAVTPFAVGPSATLSPDGSHIVYLGPDDQGRTQLWLRPLDQLSATPIPGTTWGYNWSFSPDGQSLEFRQGLGIVDLRVVSLSGALPFTLTDSARVLAGDWGPDGYVYFTNPQWGLSRIPASGGTAEVLTVPDTARGEGMHSWPDVLPNGQGVVFTLGSRPLASVDGYSIAVLDLASGEYRSVLQGVHA